MRITIKSRVWLLALVMLGGMLSLAILHYRSSEEELARHAELVALLAQTDLVSRSIHELQRERGLTSSYLASRDRHFLEDLHAQYAATDPRLQELIAAMPERKPRFGALETIRRKASALTLVPAEAYAQYTDLIAGLLAVCEKLAMNAADPVMQPRLSAQAHLIQAKEFLGQARGTLLAARQEGPDEPAWFAALGEKTGLFEWHWSRYRQLAGEHDPQLRAPTDGPELMQARRVLSAAMSQRSSGHKSEERAQWYQALSAAIDHLHAVERGALAALAEEARAAQASKRLHVNLARGGLLALAALVLYLALSSLRLMRSALEASLRAARRASGEAAVPRRSRGGGADEVGEISSGIGGLLDLVDRLNRQASTDPLTEALNRQGLDEIAAAEIERATRYQRRLAMIVFDLDHFKLVNDQFGHTAGDAVLRAMARVVHAHLRVADVFARWGGEEFIILAPESSEEDAAQLAEKLRALFQDFRAPGLPTFTASFGVASFLPEESFQSWFERADRALYAAKVAGRNRVICFDAQAHAVQAAEKPGRRRLTVIRNRNPRQGR